MTSPSLLRRLARWLRGSRGVYLCYALLHATWLVTHAGGDRWRVLIGDALFAPTFFVIAIFAWRAARAYRKAGRRAPGSGARQFARGWRLLAAAYALLWVSNLFWFWSDVTSPQSIEPAVAQGLDLIAYLILVGGLLCFPSTRSEREVRRRITLDLVTVGVSATLVTWYLLILPLASRTGSSSFGDLGAFITTFGDVVVIVAVSAIMFRHGYFRDRRWLRWLAAGHLCSCLASLIAGVLQLRGTYVPGAPVDALWVLADVLIFFAVVSATEQAAATADTTIPRVPDAVRRWDAGDATMYAPVLGVQMWLPYVFVVLAFGVLVAATADQWRDPLGIVMAGNAVVLALVGLRQFLAFYDNLRLARAQIDQETRFRSLVQFSSDLITVVDRHGTILYQSPAVERVLGYAPRETVGTVALPLLHPEEHERFSLLMHHALADFDRTARVGTRGARNVRLGSGRPSIWRLRHKSGRYIWVESVATALANEPDGLLVINTRDVSERVLLEDELRSAQKMEAIGRLAGGIAHDFNNLLTTVRVNAALLRPAGATATDVPSELDEIEAAVDRAASLTRRLLTFSRQQVIQTVRVDVGELVTGLEPLMRRLLGPAVALSVTGEDACCVQADAAQLEQVLMNLAVNSSEAMPAGGTLSIHVGSSIVTTAHARGEPGLLPGAYVNLVVHDSGTGMSADTMTHLFEPFYTTKQTGGGLGLSTVFGIVTALGGHVAVQSDAAEGTRFDIRLPRASVTPASVTPGTVPPELPRRDAQRPQRLAPPGRGERILVVDDEESVRHSLQRILVRHGYEVLVAGDGIEALEVEAATVGTIHLMLTDMMMPRMDGRELVTEFGRRRPGAAIICMSGYMDDTLRESLPLDDFAFLAKPFGIDAVIELVRRALEAHPGAG